MDVDKLAKKDNKRHSTGKITKHERKNKASGRTGKPQLQIISDSSDDESSKASTEEGGAPLEGGLGEKQRNKETRFCVEALKTRIEVKTLCPSTTTSGLYIQAEKAHKMQNKAERQHQKRAERVAKEQKLSGTTTATALGADEGGGSSANDTMAIEPSNVQPPLDDEDDNVDMEDGGASLQNKGLGYTAPPSGMNRTVRQRLKLIGRERARIQEELGVPVGTQEKADEVERRLDMWNKKFDERTKIREAKKQERKARQAARFQSEGGRHVMSGKLQEEENLFST